MIFTLGNSGLFERQFAECEIDVDPGSRMPHEQYAASFCKLQSVLNAREDVVLRGEPDGPYPVRFRQNRQGIDILGEAGPAQNRRRYATNDHRRNACCVEPSHQVRERRLKGCWEAINH
jgi:hypothetical protein